jgi:hypothetical protein
MKDQDRIHLVEIEVSSLKPFLGQSSFLSNYIKQGTSTTAVVGKSSRRPNTLQQPNMEKIVFFALCCLPVFSWWDSAHMTTVAIAQKVW